MKQEARRLGDYAIQSNMKSTADAFSIFASLRLKFWSGKFFSNAKVEVDVRVDKMIGEISHFSKSILSLIHI